MGIFGNRGNEESAFPKGETPNQALDRLRRERKQYSDLIIRLRKEGETDEADRLLDMMLTPLDEAIKIKDSDYRSTIGTTPRAFLGKRTPQGADRAVIAKENRESWSLKAQRAVEDLKKRGQLPPEFSLDNI